MITEIILGIVIITLIGYIVWKDSHYGKERRELLNAVLSKTSIEFATANRIDNPEDKVEVVEEEPDEVDQDKQSDEEFFKGIKQMNKEEKN